MTTDTFAKISNRYFWLATVLMLPLTKYGHATMNQFNKLMLQCVQLIKETYWFCQTQHILNICMHHLYFRESVCYNNYNYI